MEFLDSDNGVCPGQGFESVQEPTVSLNHGAGHWPAFEDGVGSSAAVLGPGGAALPHLRRRGLRWVNDTGIRRTAGSLRSPDPGGCSLLWVGWRGWLVQVVPVTVPGGGCSSRT